MTAAGILGDIAALCAISFVSVLAHEYGHALAVVRNSGRVKSLNIGFGPVLFSRPIKLGQLKTDFCVRLFFLGGYVALDEASFGSFSRVQRVLVYSGGVLMNLLLAVLAFAWITINPNQITPSQYVTRDVPPANAVGDALTPMNTTYALRSVKETATRTEWRFESPSSAEEVVHVKALAKPCSPDCDGVLLRVFGVELSKAFRRDAKSQGQAQELVVLSVAGRRFGSIDAFQAYLHDAARTNAKLSIEAICDNKFCKREADASALLADAWRPVDPRDFPVVAETWPLVSLPWVLAQEIVRAVTEGVNVFYATISGAGPQQYAGALTGLAEHYKAQGASFSGWAYLFLAVNVLFAVFNCVPFFGSDGYRLLKSLIDGKSNWHRVLHRALLVASIGLGIFFLLGALGSYIFFWKFLASIFG